MQLIVLFSLWLSSLALAEVTEVALEADDLSATLPAIRCESLLQSKVRSYVYPGYTRSVSYAPYGLAKLKGDANLFARIFNSETVIGDSYHSPHPWNSAPELISTDTRVIITPNIGSDGRVNYWIVYKVSKHEKFLLDAYTTDINDPSKYVYYDPYLGPSQESDLGKSPDYVAWEKMLKTGKVRKAWGRGQGWSNARQDRPAPQTPWLVTESEFHNNQHGENWYRVKRNAYWDLCTPIQIIKPGDIDWEAAKKERPCASMKSNPVVDAKWEEGSGQFSERFTDPDTAPNCLGDMWVNDAVTLEQKNDEAAIWGLIPVYGTIYNGVHCYNDGDPGCWKGVVADSATDLAGFVVPMVKGQSLAKFAKLRTGLKYSGAAAAIIGVGLNYDIAAENFENDNALGGVTRIIEGTFNLIHVDFLAQGAFRTMRARKFANIAPNKCPKVLARTKSLSRAQLIARATRRAAPTRLGKELADADLWKRHMSGWRWDQNNLSMLEQSQRFGEALELYIRGGTVDGKTIPGLVSFLKKVADKGVDDTNADAIFEDFMRQIEEATQYANGKADSAFYSLEAAIAKGTQGTYGVRKQLSDFETPSEPGFRFSGLEPAEVKRDIFKFGVEHNQAQFWGMDAPVKINIGDAEHVVLKLTMSPDDLEAFNYKYIEQGMDVGAATEFPVYAAYKADAAITEKAWKEMKELMYEALNGDPTEIYEAALRMEELTVKVMPWKKGSSSIGNTIKTALLEFGGIRVGQVRQGVGFDIKHWVSESYDDLLDNYPSFYQE